ncbi:hypothetical protein J6590_057134 [Homalodisca vitripennis]|nr:hypothetical protein J6590_057134 [Homalodisca vitripennis]
MYTINTTYKSYRVSSVLTEPRHLPGMLYLRRYGFHCYPWCNNSVVTAQKKGHKQDLTSTPSKVEQKRKIKVCISCGIATPHLRGCGGIKAAASGLVILSYSTP